MHAILKIGPCTLPHQFLFSVCWSERGRLDLCCVSTFNAHQIGSDWITIISISISYENIEKYSKGMFSASLLWICWIVFVVHYVWLHITLYRHVLRLYISNSPPGALSYPRSNLKTSIHAPYYIEHHSFIFCDKSRKLVKLKTVIHAPYYIEHHSFICDKLMKNIGTKNSHPCSTIEHHSLIFCDKSRKW